MNEELKNQLEWINENLNTLAQNQVMIYEELQKIEKKMQQVKEQTE
jgi:chaperonin cofactor prefoldin